jgi:small subunit ribosomal protein S8
MSMMDPIADLLARVRNAHLAKHDRLDVPASKLTSEICRILHQEGLIKSFKPVVREAGSEEPDDQRLGGRSLLRIFLRYSDQGEPAMLHLRRVSRPGRRVYRGADTIRPVLNGLGVGIVSTSQGLLTDKQARERRLGGEVLCEIW